MGAQHGQYIRYRLVRQRAVDLLGNLARSDQAAAPEHRQLLGERRLPQRTVRQQFASALLAIKQLAEHQQPLGMGQRLEQGRRLAGMPGHLIERVHRHKLAIAYIKLHSINKT
jgi:hypothetical protein